MTILKYCILYAYIGFDVIVFGFLFSKVVGKEYSRKITHMLLFGLWILIDLFFKGTIHIVIFPATIIVTNTIAYLFGLDKAIEREGEKKHPGIIYFAIAVTIIYLIAYLAPETYPYTCVGVACLTFGDGSAAIFGNLIKSKKILPHKSISGFLGCLITTFISLVIIKYFYLNELSFLIITVISLYCAILELFQYGLDNLSVTIICFLMSYFMSILSVDFTIGAIIALVTIMLVFFLKLIDYYGSLLAGVYILFFYDIGSFKLLSILMGCYILSVIIHVIRKVKKVNCDDIVEKEHKKDFFQILVNGIFALCACLLCQIADDVRFLYIACICISASFIDSVSSDIGTMSKKDSYDIFKRKRVEKGLSGGISFLGSISSLIGAILLAVYIVVLYSLSPIYVLYYTLLILSGTIVDTIFGSLLQVKYKCSECGKITEKKTHCNKETVYHSGFRFVNNDIVNLMASYVTFCISFIFIIWVI